MPRKYAENEKPSPVTYKVKRTRKNGTTYVVEVNTIYDLETRRTKILSSRTVGKLPPGETDISKMVETDKSYVRNPTGSKVRKSAVEDAAIGTDIEDPRRIECVRYPLDIVLFVIVMAATSGVTSNYGIAEYWKANRAVLEKYIPNFPRHDISHDTVRRIIQILGRSDAGELVRTFTEPLVRHMKERVVALDGQAVRAALGDEGRYALNLYDTDNGLCLNQIWIEAKENEITRSIEAIEKIDLGGVLFTCDALNTQKKLCKALVTRGADYCMALKGNHPGLRNEVEGWFETTTARTAKVAVETSIGHGRTETREVRVLPASVVSANRSLIKPWYGLEDGCFVKAVTRSVNDKTGAVTCESRYYICSLAFDEQYVAKRVMRAVRGHWKIENSLHWVLDVTFNQDRTQCRNADYISGRTALTKVAYNLLSAIQTREEEESGKAAPSKASLKARFSNAETLIKALLEIRAAKE